MEVYQEITEEYTIKLNNREEAEFLHGILEFISRNSIQEELGDRVSKEEFELAKNLAKELDTYLNFDF